MLLLAKILYMRHQLMSEALYLRTLCFDFVILAKRHAFTDHVIQFLLNFNKLCTLGGLKTVVIIS